VPLAGCADQPWHCLEGRRDLDRPQVLVCRGTTCRLPAFSADEVATALAEAS
jgi:hypothetical protein